MSVQHQGKGGVVWGGGERAATSPHDAAARAPSVEEPDEPRCEALLWWVVPVAVASPGTPPPSVSSPVAADVAIPSARPPPPSSSVPLTQASRSYPHLPPPPRLFPRTDAAPLSLRSPPPHRQLTRVWKETETLSKWESTSWAKKLRSRTLRAKTTDFERFQIMLARKERSAALK